MASSSMKRDPALVPVVAALWLALGVFIIYPFIRLLAVTFTAEDGGLLNSMTRDRIISLAEQYHGAVRLVYLETGWDTGLARNRQRKEEVPEAVIGQMLSRLEPPGPDEARRVEWHCV